ncbi:hypothetical protein UFOVP1608_57 [uncultured Caudovirales phage]|uniref:Uncharacterized protein n=1 Tax=uncultured Caudovirales phage TaxID=2100421 RepID=A0A6J5SVQ9_9CAUD|nr:hypothetical protein UFOVP1608_57 [uncultured Caudovirales phage]
MKATLEKLVSSTNNSIVLYRTAPWNANLTSDVNFNVTRYAQVGDRKFKVEGESPLWKVEEVDAAGECLSEYLGNYEWNFIGSLGHVFGLDAVRDLIAKTVA